jgi:hypothetical protein
MDTFYCNWGKGNHILNEKLKTKNLTWNINILDEGYPLYDEGIA